MFDIGKNADTIMCGLFVVDDLKLKRPSVPDLSGPAFPQTNQRAGAIYFQDTE